MGKNIDYYMSLPYRRELIPEPEGGWFIRIVELPGCMSQGETVEEANAMIEDAMRGWLEAELARGSSIPEPRREEEFSGKFVVRVAKSLHRKLDEVAEREGVSLNQWINSALAETVGQAQAHFPGEQAKEAQAPLSSLHSAMHEILQNVGYKNDPAAGEELLFGNWLIQNLAEIRQDYQHHHFEMAVTKARALNSAIEKQCEPSPVLQVIQASIMNQVLILETAGELQTRALQADQMRQQIGTIIGLVNARPMSSGQSEKIDQNLDDSWISDLDFLKKIPTEKKNNAGSTGSF